MNMKMRLTLLILLQTCVCQMEWKNCKQKFKYLRMSWKGITVNCLFILSVYFHFIWVCVPLNTDSECNTLKALKWLGDRHLEYVLSLCMDVVNTFCMYSFCNSFSFISFSHLNMLHFPWRCKLCRLRSDAVFQMW